MKDAPDWLCRLAFWGVGNGLVDSSFHLQGRTGYRNLTEFTPNACQVWQHQSTMVFKLVTTNLWLCEIRTPYLAISAKERVAHNAFRCVLFHSSNHSKALRNACTCNCPSSYKRSTASVADKLVRGQPRSSKLKHSRGERLYPEGAQLS